MGALSRFVLICLVLFAIFFESMRRTLQVPINITRYDMSGQHVIVTGATAGIGKETAKVMLEWGAEVVIGSRNLKKGKTIVSELKKVTGKTGCQAMELDLASFDSVRKFASEYKESGLPLNILVNNAGMWASGDIQFTTDGLERQVQTNHFGPFLLTNLLMDLLVESAPSRVVNVASGAFRFGSIDLNDLNTTAPSTEFGRYSTTKLMNIVFSTELNRRLADAGHTDVVSHSLHPGGIYTALFKEWNQYLEMAMELVAPFLFRSVEDGAKSTIMLSTDPAYAPNTSGGRYFEDAVAVVPDNLQATDPKLGKAFWEASMRVVGMQEEGMGNKSDAFL